MGVLALVLLLPFLGFWLLIASPGADVQPVGGAIGSSTLRAIPGGQVSSLGTVKVKGKREPVEAWELHGLDGAAPK